MLRLDSVARRLRFLRQVHSMTRHQVLAEMDRILRERIVDRKIRWVPRGHRDLFYLELHHRHRPHRTLLNILAEIFQVDERWLAKGGDLPPTLYRAVIEEAERQDLIAAARRQEMELAALRRRLHAVHPTVGAVA